MLNALADLDPDELEQDTAQYLNYLYNMGAGGAITHGTPQEICQAEFDMLIRLYFWQVAAILIHTGRQTHCNLSANIFRIRNSAISW